MLERKFLLNLALNRYNEQYNTKHNTTDFDIFSIPPRENTALGYEIYSTRFDDNLRIRLYLRLTDKTRVDRYRLNTDSTYKVEQLGDEVFVAIGELDDTLRKDGTYKFRWIDIDPNRLFIFITEEGVPFQMEDGEEYWLLENGF